jgi:DNA-binding MarR family transcriptional regulator
MELVQAPQVEQEISRLISNSFIHLDDSDRQLMRHFGLTVTQFWALVHIQDEEGRSLSELAGLLLCDKSNVTSIVDKLEESGLAERKRGKAGDRRYTRVVLTKEGHELRSRAIAARELLIQLRLGVLQSDELHQVVSSLQRLSEALQAQFVDGEVTNFIKFAVERSQAVV